MKNKVWIQAFILGIGQVGGKILSLIFLFRFAGDIRPFGLYLYTYAYIPFSLFLDLSAFGLIPGVAKGVSKLLADRNDKKVYYILKIGTVFCFCLGILFFLFLNIFNEKILAVTLYKGYTEEEYGIILEHLKLSSITLFIFPLLSFYKGYLQGKFQMLPSCIAILIENSIRVISYIFVSKTIDITLIRKVFICNFFSYLGALLFLFIWVFKDYFKEKEKFHSLSYILKITLPFGSVTMFFTFFQLIDSITLSTLGVDSHIYTTYMFESIRLIFIPIVFAQSMGGVLNPKMNTLYTQDKKQAAQKIAEKYTSWIIYFLVFVVVLFRIYAKEMYSFFYKEEEYYFILADTAILIFFIGFYKVIIGIAQGLNQFHYVAVSTIVSSIAKIVLNVLFVPYYSYKGAILSTCIAIGICMLVSYFILNLAHIKIFLYNVATILLSFIVVEFSLFLATIYRVTILLNRFSEIKEAVLFSFVSAGIYLMLLCFIRLFQVAKSPVSS